MDRVDLQDLLRDQNGSLTREQAKAAGLSPSSISRRLRSGAWTEALPGVLRAVDHPDRPLDRVRRAGLWAGERGTVVGGGALAWWRMSDTVPEPVRVARPLGSGAAAPPGVAVRRIAIADEDRLRVDGIVVTTRPRTVLDAAVELGLTDGARIVDRALQDGKVSVASLRDVVDRTAGTWGTALGRRLVELAEGAARSEAERRTVRALRRSGIRDFVVNLEIGLPGGGRAVLDVAFPQARLVIEVDGWAFHRDVDAFRRDARRQNAIVLAGWRVLRVTWYDICGDDTAMIDSVVRALTARS